MTWETHYVSPNSHHWQGRPDAPKESCIFQHIKMLNLREQIFPKPGPIAFGIIGFCCDEGISRNLGRVGAAEGPSAIREALGKLPLHRRDIECYDVGDISCTDKDLESAQSALAEAIALLLEHKITPIVLGGGHELAWGHYQGIAKVYPKDNLGIINFDAHFDMRPLLEGGKGSSGTPFLQIAKAHEAKDSRFDYNCIGIQESSNLAQLFETANRYNTQFILADDVHQGNKTKCMNFINRIIFYNKYIYMTLCLDVFASAFAPAVSAPQALGVTPWQVMPYIKALAQSGKMLSYDLAELSPKYDMDNRTAKLAATLVHELIHHHQNS